jgi:aspartyl-tRNA(Asn)/glutamyl-tRNA(Gln) amidotransferase subunit B
MTTQGYRTAIGLEVHAQLLTKSKLFCSCSTRFGAPPNTHTCPVCLGLPGALPALNRQALACALRAARALGCRVNGRSRFSRKNYFYPDLPKGYQISQYRLPLAVEGFIEIPKNGAAAKRVRIHRLHMEEDAGKLVHLAHEGTGTGTAVDLNRAGVPLAEIVSEPDIDSPEEAQAYMSELRLVLLHLGVCACNMEEGNLRCDANISVAPAGSKELGTRTEIKNLNSMRFLRQALEYEVARQEDVLREGGKVVHETLLFDPEKRETRSMRSKEEAHDYRYFPEPDLPPVEVGEAWLREIEKNLPELPMKKRERFVRDFGIPAYDANVLTQEPELAAFFEETARLVAGDPKAASNWLMTEALREVKESETSLRESKLTPALLAELLKLVAEGAISGKIAKEIFPEVFRAGASPRALVEKKGLGQISDEGALRGAVEEVLKEHASVAEEVRGGKEKSFGFLMGQVMKKTRGRANPKLVQKIMREALGRV